MASPTASSSRGNPRAWLALVVAVCGVLTIPAAIEFTRRVSGVVLLDASYAIPVAMALSVAALLFARGARGHIRQTLERAGGLGRLRLARWIAVAGICVALSCAISVGFYELLVRLEG